VTKQHASSQATLMPLSLDWNSYKSTEVIVVMCGHMDTPVRCTYRPRSCSRGKGNATRWPDRRRIQWQRAKSRPSCPRSPWRPRPPAGLPREGSGCEFWWRWEPWRALALVVVARTPETVITLSTSAITIRPLRGRRMTNGLEFYLCVRERETWRWDTS
jgi:hypothetical protein